MAMSQNLSPFHAELLDFMRRDCLGKIAADGFDEDADPELKAFQKSLGRLREDEPLLLDEIVEKYQYLFGSRGPLHLEKKLMAAFHAKDAKVHPIRIYRGLPRLYKRENPAESRVLKAFTHLSQLLFLAAEKEIFQLYAEKDVEEAKVSLFSWVMGDGWGDYIAGLESIEILKERFPHLQLSWVALFPKHLGSPPVPKLAKTHLIYYDKECSVFSIKGEALEILRTSDLVLQIPTFYPSFDELQNAVENIAFSSLPPKWVSIGEYGFVESKWHHPETGNRSMGLHFLEKGIIIKPQSRQAKPRFSEIESHELLQWMFNTGSPGPEEIEQYKNERHFYLAYLTSSIGGAVYLHALAKAHERDKKGIDICSPDIGWLIGHIETQTRAGFPVLELEGISVELYFQGKVLPLAKAQAGNKTIRIFSPPHLTPSDFHRLIQLSGEFVAIRGNQSFSEVVSANIGFFFDGRAHVRFFLKDLLALAENRIRAHKNTLEVMRGMMKAFLYNIPIGTEEWVEETDFHEREPWKEIALKIGAALQKPDCLEGFKKMNRIIAEEHSFNDFLCHLVQRELTHRAHPETAAIEEESIRPFREGRIPLPAAIENLKNRFESGR
jgi:hypothetical protein